MNDVYKIQTEKQENGMFPTLSNLVELKYEYDYCGFSDEVLYKLENALKISICECFSNYIIYMNFRKDFLYVKFNKSINKNNKNYLFIYYDKYKYDEKESCLIYEENE